MIKMWMCLHQERLNQNRSSREPWRDQRRMHWSVQIWYLKKRSIPMTRAILMTKKRKMLTMKVRHLILCIEVRELNGGVSKPK
jgi:hypothetical protein